MQNEDDAQRPEYLVSGLNRAPGTITVRRPVIAAAALAAFGFLGLMLWIVVGRVSALALPAGSGAATTPGVIASARPASISDLGLSQAPTKSLPVEATPAPEATVSTADLTGSVVTPPPLNAQAQAQLQAQMQAQSQMNQAPQQVAQAMPASMPISMPQEASPERLAEMAHQAVVTQARQAALASDMNVHIDTAAADPRAPQNAASVDAPSSEFMLLRGMLIPATMLTSVDSTLPGLVVALVSQDVYDSQHRVVVIPRGSRITGTFASGVAQGQRRLSVSWDEIQLPNNKMLELGDFPGVDLSGTSGLGAAVDNHTRRAFTNVLLLSMLSAGAQLAQPQTSNTSCGSSNCAAGVGQVAASAVGTNIANLGNQLLARDANIQPTLHIVEGSQVGVMVVHNIPVQPYQ